MKNHGTSKFMEAPAYPFTGSALFDDLRRRLAQQLGRSLGFEQLGRLIGKSTSTAYFWFCVYEHPHVVALMALLERLPPVERHRFIDTHCRDYPTLSHPRLSFAPGAKGQLLALQTQRKGLTMITGGTGQTRAFLATALGHESPQATGIDIHRPKQFVPIPSVHYIDERISSSSLRALIDEVWPRLLTAKSPLLLLVGVWSRCPDLRADILRCAERKHVVVAEHNISCEVWQRPFPVHVISLSSGDQIHVTCVRV